MKVYTGIGSRDITPQEKQRIRMVAKFMNMNGYTLYSGSAHGADLTFQEGSEGNLVSFLPWPAFNEKDDVFGGQKIALQDATKEDIDNAYKSLRYHPAPNNLTRASRAFMARNYFQVMGANGLSRSELVICCADPCKGSVKGGTGQAVRIALDIGVPVINLRENGWLDKIRENICTT